MVLFLTCWSCNEVLSHCKINSFLPSSKAQELATPSTYQPGDWIAKKATILCDVNTLSKLSPLHKDSFIHHGLVTIIILLEIISDERTYLSMYTQSVFPFCFCYADVLKSEAPGRPLGSVSKSLRLTQQKCVKQLSHYVLQQCIMHMISCILQKQAANRVQIKHMWNIIYWQDFVPTGFNSESSVICRSISVSF